MNDSLTSKIYLAGFGVRNHKILRRVALFAAIIALYLTGFAGRRINALPEYDVFLEAFFQEPFVLFVCLQIAWFAASFKTSPSRTREYTMLHSLPIPGESIYFRLLYQDFFRYWWVPAFGVVLHMSLFFVAPFPFLCRLSLLSLCCFAVAVTANTLLHLLPGNYYPEKNNPLIYALSITGYALLHLFFIVNAKVMSGYRFLLTVVLLIIFNYSLVIISRKIFSRWQSNNRAYSMRAVSPRADSSTVPLARTNLFLRFPRTNPLLLKNMVKVAREKSSFSTLLTLFFIATIYFISMNNELMNDSISVLFVLFCGYAFLFSFRGIDTFSREEEAPEIIHLLPVNKTGVFGAALLPSLVWLTAMSLLFGALVAFSGAEFAAAAQLIGKSLLAGISLLLVAFAFALSCYPDAKTAKKRYLYWALFTTVFSAIFYVYSYIILCCMILAPLFTLRRVHFYRVV